MRRRLLAWKMPKEEQLALLQAMIGLLQAERGEQEKLPSNLAEAETSWRALVNTRPAGPVSAAYEALEARYLTWRNGRAVKTLADCQQVGHNLYFYEGDLTELAASAIVNPANSQLLGCFEPNHACLDNAIHTWAGTALRLDCFRLMAEQGRKEAVGQAKLTPAYHLPAEAVIHTVGPFIPAGKPVSPIRAGLLKQSYLACLDLADKEDLASLALPCISTGQFGFPKDLAAKIAVETVTSWLAARESSLQVIFAVYDPEDQQLYKTLLEAEIWP